MKTKTPQKAQSYYSVNLSIKSINPSHINISHKTPSLSPPKPRKKLSPISTPQKPLLTTLFSDIRKSKIHNRKKLERSLSSLTHHQDLIKEMSLIKNQNFPFNRNELRAKINVTKEQWNDINKDKKKFLIKTTPARFKKYENRDNLKKNYNKIYDDYDFLGVAKNTIQKWKFKKKETDLNYYKSKIEPLIIKKSENFYAETNSLDNNQSIKIISKKEENKEIIIMPEFLGEVGSANKFFKIENLNRPKKMNELLKEGILKQKTTNTPFLHCKTEGIENVESQKIGNIYGIERKDNELDDYDLREKLKDPKFMPNLSNNTKDRKKKIRIMLKQALLFLNSLKLTLNEIIGNKIFSTKPFEKRGSYELINACKNGDIHTVRDLLSMNKYLVYDFDYVFLTGLHWASKRGHFDVAKTLLKYGADINSKDLIGRTPLYLSIKHDKLDLMQLFLFNKADPWSNSKIDYKSLVKTKPQASKILTKARKLQILLTMTPPAQRNYVWQKDSWTLLLETGRDDYLLKKLTM